MMQEELLEKILLKLDSMDNRLEKLENGQTELGQEVKKLKEGQERLEAGQSRIELKLEQAHSDIKGLGDGISLNYERNAEQHKDIMDMLGGEINLVKGAIRFINKKKNA